jgi:uncharacterized membrane protein YfcA
MRPKADVLTVVLAILAVVCIVIGAVIIGGHLKRGLLALVVGALLAAAAGYAAVRAGQRSGSSRRH